MDRKLHLSRKNKVIAGVCGGLGEYFGMDPVIIRIIVTILFFMSYSSLGIVYIILWAIIPMES